MQATDTGAAMSGPMTYRWTHDDPLSSLPIDHDGHDARSGRSPQKLSSKHSHDGPHEVAPKATIIMIITMTPSRVYGPVSSSAA